MAQPYGNPGLAPGPEPGPSASDALAILGDEGEAPQLGMQDEITSAIAGLDEAQQMQVLDFINSLRQPVDQGIPAGPPVGPGAVPPVGPTAPPLGV